MLKIARLLGVTVGLATISITSVHGLEKKVQVEAAYQLKKNKNGKNELLENYYRDRRPRWGVRLNFAISSGFETEETKPHPVTGVEKTFESNGTPFHINIGMSRNFKYFSIGPELGYMSSSLTDSCDLDMDFKGFTFGVGAYLDGLFKRAYAVPFFSAGVLFPEITTNVTQQGTCTVEDEKDLDTLDYALYYRAGFLIGLNWIDRKMVYSALKDYGLQNSFIYVAMKQIPNTSDIDEANVGTAPFLEYGLQFEF